MEKEKKYTVSLRAARVNAKLSQLDVCKSLHVSKTTVVKWEGENYVNEITLIALCDLYNVPDKSYIKMDERKSKKYS